MPNYEEMEQNPSGRMAEGMNTVTLSRARVNEFKGREVMIVTWKDQTGAEIDDWFDDEKRNWARLFGLCRVLGIKWTGDIEWSAVAKLIENNAISVDVQVVWGKGDKAYCKAYFAAGTGGGMEEAPAPSYQQPQATQPAALTPESF